MKRSFKRGRASHVGGLLKNTLQALGVEERLLEQSVVEKWANVVGPHIAASSRAEEVREGALFVACKNSMWSSELTLHKPDIINRLNAAVGKAVVKDIRFKARGFRKAEPDKELSERVKAEPIELEESEIQTADAIASACQSEGLAVKIRQAVLASKRLNAEKRREGYKQCIKCGELHADEREICDSCRTLR